MQHISSKLIHGNSFNRGSQNNRSLKTPIYQSASFDFENSQEVEQAFRGESDAYVYSRISNPTVNELENRLKLFTDAKHCVCVSSGMAAIANVFFTLCSSGDNIITSKYLFGNTFSFFAKTLKEFGVEARFVDMENIAEIEQNIDANTRAIFVEILTNPQLIIFDFEKIANLSNKYDIPLIADNSVLTPYIFQSKNYGIDIEVFSNTKFISGGATSIGGSVLVYDSKKWAKIPKLVNEVKQFGNDAFFKRLHKEIYRNIGACLSPHTAYLQLLGLETIALRIDKINNDALIAAEFLASQKNILSVNYASLPSSPYKKLADKYLNSMGGCLINLELKNKEECYKFMDALKMIRRGTNFCDNKSMIIHPASTIYWEYSPENKQQMKITEGMMRLSIGLENINDIIDDITQALNLL